MLVARSLVNFAHRATSNITRKQNSLSFLCFPIQRMRDSKSFSTTPKQDVNLKHSEETTKANWQGRVDLATAFRGLDMLNLNEGIDNHLSLMIPAANGDDTVMLINPVGYSWKEMKPEYLVGVNTQGEVVEGKGAVEITAMTIHLGVHKTNPNAKCVFHLHPPYSTALGMLKKRPFGMYHQNSTLHYKDYAYDRHYKGLSLDYDEGERIAKHIGDKHVLFMCNHGVMVVGSSVANVFSDVYYLERACMFQVLAMSTGEELYEIPEEFCKINKEFWEATKEDYSARFLDAYKRLSGMEQGPLDEGLEELHETK